ncbi:MAG TPA: aminotransferase class V-fold PLP-dependent enzyme [Thermoleophilaceae bacterium]|nr:aminotransferase class V-fold PLP-dependent enzyme [Thermoleophilaceae bacterium]
MQLTRRGLLAGGGVAGATALVAGGYLVGRETAGDDDGETTASAPDDGGGPLFELDPRYANLTTFVLASHPRPVRGAIERHRRKLDENTALYLQEAEVQLEEASRSALAGYLGVRPDQVALTDSTTMGVSLAYARLKLGPGDEVVTSEHDFYATHEALRLRERLDGVAVRRVRMYDEPESASVDGMVSSVARALGPRTRALALTWVHSSTGVKLPLREIAAAVASANRGRRERERILLCVDGVHGFGVEDASPAELGIDVLASGCHKWLFGPRGTGFVWAAPHAWSRLAPTIPSFDPRVYSAWIEGHPPRDAPPGALMTPGGFHSFEHRWALPEAIGVHTALGGRAEVARRTHALAAELKEGLAGIDGVRVRTPEDEAMSAGLVCCEVNGLDPREVVDRLREEHRVVASVTPYRTRYVRFGPSVANRGGDVERAVEAMAAIARRA